LGSCGPPTGPARGSRVAGRVSESVSVSEFVGVTRKARAAAHTTRAGLRWPASQSDGVLALVAPPASRAVVETAPLDRAQAPRFQQARPTSGWREGSAGGEPGTRPEGHPRARRTRRRTHPGRGRIRKAKPVRLLVFFVLLVVPRGRFVNRRKAWGRFMNTPTVSSWRGSASHRCEAPGCAPSAPRPRARRRRAARRCRK
jgi:hypothetical protein